MKYKKNALEPRWLLVFSFFAAGIFLGSLSIYLWIGGGSSPFTVKLHSAQKGSKYTNPLLAVDISNGMQFSQNSSLYLKLHGMVDNAKQNGEINEAGIYFQDLETGAWVGINDTIPYIPGRILRLPIMITYYKLAQADPTILTQSLVFNGPNQNAGQPFTPASTLEVGQAYTVDDLIQRMIVEGDDNAAVLLFSNIDKNSLHEVFSDLGINFNENDQLISSISLKQTSLFYRILYNATYLNKEYSEKALALLVTADNSIGLGALLPKDIEFANRYNATASRGNPQRFDMTDCGIAYYPSHPYLICTRITGAQNLGSAEKLLAQVGNAVYSDINYQFKEQ